MSRNPDQNLIDAVKEKAILRGDFTLRSGKKSDWYFNKFALSSDPWILSRVAGLIALSIDSLRTYELYDIDPNRLFIAALELGAVAFAAVAGVHPMARLPLVIVRKEAKTYGNLTNSRLEGNVPLNGVGILIEDVVTTGGAVLSALDAIDAAGFTCNDVIAVFDREEGGAAAIRGRRAGMKFQAILTKAELEL